MNIKTASAYFQSGTPFDILFWVGCAGSFDQRAQKVTKALALILERAGISFAILGKEELCTGDPARRSGNEFLFQMMAQQNIQTLNDYQIKKIVTACPHCFNTLKNEYPALGGNYEVIHHTQLIQELIEEGKIILKENGLYKGQKITFHDSCYLGRSNNIYEAPRKVLEALETELKEMKRCKSNGLCCGAGGAQMFKEEEKGTIRVNRERAHEIIEMKTPFVAVACPFCNTMLQDGLQVNGAVSSSTEILDIAELVAQSLQQDSSTDES